MGRITLGDESNQVRTKIKEMLGKGKSQIVLNLAGVSHIDSAGLGMLVCGLHFGPESGRHAQAGKPYEDIPRTTQHHEVGDHF